MGAVPGTSSMANSISRSGGKPDTSWNTYGNSHTMGMFSSSTSGVSTTSTAHKNVVQPYRTNLRALIAEIK